MIVIVGGSSRIGRALRRQLTDREVIAITRRTGQPDTLQLSDYRDTAQHIAPGSVVVNCVGISDARRGDLLAVNSELAIELARTASEVGARLFIQISSFSVYGTAGRINHQTPERPLSAYGRSKLAADHALLAMHAPLMIRSLLRLPALIDEPDTGKLGKLVRIAARLGGLPFPSPDVRRSMMTYADAAFVVRSLIDKPVIGVSLAADPQPFGYGFLEEQWQQVAGQPLRALCVPKLLTDFARAVLGKNGASLLGDSMLEPSSNLAEALALPVGLTHALRCTIAAETKRC